MSTVEIVDAFAGDPRRLGDARTLVFEYMAATVVEMSGPPAPAHVDDLPPVLREECRDPAAVYRDPGTFLVAYSGGPATPAGCAGLVPRAERTAEVKRLYVRPAYRGAGIARDLMSSVHAHAARAGITTLILDVLTSRVHVISFYRRLGYTDTEPFPTTSPLPMVYLRRPVGPADIRLS